MFLTKQQMVSALLALITIVCLTFLVVTNKQPIKQPQSSRPPSERGPCQLD